MEFEARHGCHPTDKSYRDMISNLLFTYVTNFLAVKPMLTRILMDMDLGPLYIVKGKTMLI
jgi:hypothetical protein